MAAIEGAGGRIERWMQENNGDLHRTMEACQVLSKSLNDMVEVEKNKDR